MKRSNGFTLLELMITIAIMAIMVSLAYPSYQDSIMRARISETLNMAEAVKQPIMDYYKYHGRFPQSNEQAGVPEAQLFIGNYTKSVEINDGAIHITLGNKVIESAQGMVLTVRPIVVTGSPASPVSWICGFDLPPDGMQAVGENRTDIPNYYLPVSCRS